MFDRNGEFLSKLVFAMAPNNQPQQSQQQQLEEPSAIAVNSQILAVIYKSNLVRVFDVDTHRFLYQFGSEGEENGQFNAPFGIALNDKVLLLL